MQTMNLYSKKYGYYMGNILLIVIFLKNRIHILLFSTLQQIMNSNFKIFIVEDDPFYRNILNYHLSLNPDNSINCYESGQECLDNLHLKPDATTLDYSLLDISGEDILNRIFAYDNQIPVIIVSGQDDIETAINLLKKGAYDYVIKDDDAKNRIWNIINNIIEKNELKREVQDLKEQVKTQFDIKTKIISISKAMHQVITMINESLNTNITVSISEETGSGKEVVAKSIHYNSNRSRKPFIPANIAAIPKDLIETELFGREKGAFTGAIARRIGKFEEAKDGTLFLDEIGEMDLNMQAKLLRVLQERELTRVGGNEIIKLKCRVISATHKNLSEEVATGKFREDLYYRLIGLPIFCAPPS
jgi:DNA-binding NtrC family response regulator